jgi:hypothetical protein
MFRDQGVKYKLSIFRLFVLCLFESWRYIIFAIIVVSKTWVIQIGLNRFDSFYGGGDLLVVWVYRC